MEWVYNILDWYRALYVILGYTLFPRIIITSRDDISINMEFYTYHTYTVDM